MAYTLIQSSSTPNAAYTRLLYTVSGSSNVSKPLFQYVCDIHNSGSSSIIKRVTQTPNPAGTATFDVARIVQGQLAVDYNWDVNAPTQFANSFKDFEVKFGEQYASSISSSVVVINAIVSTDIDAFQGVVEPNAGTYNFSDIVDSQVMSNMPTTMSMQSDDVGTLSVYNNAGTFISKSFYSASLNASGYSLVGTENYTVGTQYCTAVPISTSIPYWNYVDVSISSSFGTEEYRYEASDDTTREKVRFAFINKFGAWDYYNNYNPVQQTISITRQEYTAPRVDYSSRLSSYDISRRGKTVNDSSTSDSFTVDTNYLDQANATWLEELIESPEVYIQRNGEFIPIVITDSSYTADTNPSRQKLFKYTINFTPANQPFGTWIPEYVEGPKPPASASIEPFDPYDVGTIDTSSLLYWYDFTDTGSMSLYADGADTAISGIHNKGYIPSASLYRGPQSLEKYSAQWIPPLYEGEYSSFRTDNISIYSNSSLTARYTGVGTDMHDYPVISTTSTFTSIMFVRPNFTSTSVNAIDFMMSGSANNFRPRTVDFYTTINLSTVLNPTASYLSTAESTLSSSFNLTGGPPTYPATPIGYSYSGSGGVSPWESRVIVKISNGITGYVTRDFATSAPYNGNYYQIGSQPVSASHENLTIGSEAQINNGQGSTFDIAHLLIYTGSLSQGVIENVITSFKESVSYGSQLNAISN